MHYDLYVCDYCGREEKRANPGLPFTWATVVGKIICADCIRTKLNK